jgi:hypothetical protein
VGAEVNRVMSSRLAGLILQGGPFTADDVTEAGALVIDGQHTPNGKQSGIGSLFNQAARRGLIYFTGNVVRSEAPHRKGGAIRVWRGTEVGVLWARSVLGPNYPSKQESEQPA